MANLKTSENLPASTNSQDLFWYDSDDSDLGLGNMPPPPAATSGTPEEAIAAINTFAMEYGYAVSIKRKGRSE